MCQCEEKFGFSLLFSIGLSQLHRNISELNEECPGINQRSSLTEKSKNPTKNVGIDLRAFPIFQKKLRIQQGMLG